ncbi:MAG TPA: hypothetical protein VKY34_05850 [Xanthomarina sp.]|nr:hypothetical protein [Xanthomarina sp.]
MTIKQQLYLQCVEYCNNRLEVIKHTIEDIQESLTAETKSSAGDKHETGRAILQLEREKAGNQLAEIQKLQEALSKIDVSKITKTISLGSIVYTTKANYFIAISAGELKVKEQVFYAISTNTPVGQLLIGKQVADVIIFREKEFKITAIL